MRKLYLLCHNGKRDEVQSLIDSSDYVLTWRYDMPNMFYLVSEHSAGEIGSDIKKRRTSEFRFLVIEGNTDNKQGWLPERTWYLLNNKKHKPK